MWCDDGYLYHRNIDNHLLGYHYWLVVSTPLKNIRLRQLGWWHSQYMKIWSLFICIFTFDSHMLYILVGGIPTQTIPNLCSKPPTRLCSQYSVRNDLYLYNHGITRLQSRYLFFRIEIAVAASSHRGSRQVPRFEPFSPLGFEVQQKIYKWNG